MHIVECENVVKTYQQGKVSVPALRGVNLFIEKGGFVSLAGPSGSGKTTVLNIIGGLDTPDTGRIIVDGNNYNDMNASQMAGLRLRQIGFVFQSYNLIPVLSALENVEYVMLLQGVHTEERKDRAMAVLDEVGLEEMYNRRPAELSGGQQQRVAVARAIVSGPAIVLADEPTANLDSKTGKNLMEIMERMNEEKGITFVFSTHDKMVMECAKKLIHIKDGMVTDDPIQSL
jgi:putative ABC transport system ATP-binding protein